MKVPRLLKRQLRYSFSAVFTAGALYWVSRNWMRVQGEFGEEPHLLERIAGPLHLISALVFVFVLGIVWSQHMRAAIRAAQHRLTGWLFLSAAAVLGCTGVAIIYLGESATTRFFAQAHPILGLSLLPLLIWHWNFKKK